MLRHVWVSLSTRDISTAHRLPGGKTGERPIIVRFARRVMKTEMLRNKKTCHRTSGFLKTYHQHVPNSSLRSKRIKELSPFGREKAQFSMFGEKMRECTR